ncbi:MAG: hypothetical protein QM658_13200 [Gordonia sp. (in: high G+C Gram-positive bacteria)]
MNGFRIDPDAVSHVVAGHRAAAEGLSRGLEVLRAPDFGGWAHTDDHAVAAAALRARVADMEAGLESCATGLAALAADLADRAGLVVAADRESS